MPKLGLINDNELMNIVSDVTPKNRENIKEDLYF